MFGNSNRLTRPLSLCGLSILLSLACFSSSHAQVVNAARKAEIARLPGAARSAALVWEAARSHTSLSDAQIVGGMRQEYPSMGRSAFSFQILNRRTQQL